jgi:hypothetical protein
MGVLKYHPSISESGSSDKTVVGGANQGKFWLLFLTVSTALVASVTSIVMHFLSAAEDQNKRELTNRREMSYAYRGFISQSRLTAHSLHDSLHCRGILYDAENPPRGSAASTDASSIGSGPCNGGQRIMDSISEIRKNNDLMHARWRDDYVKLDQSRRDLVKVASGSAAVHADAMYVLLGTPGPYDETDLAAHLQGVKSEFCRELPKDCRS